MPMPPSFRSIMKFHTFQALPKCNVCELRSCKKQGHCDDYAHLEGAIKASATAQDYGDFHTDLKGNPHVKKLNDGGLWLVYHAGELLSRKRSES